MIDTSHSSYVTLPIYDSSSGRVSPDTFDPNKSAEQFKADSNLDSDSRNDAAIALYKGFYAAGVKHGIFGGYLICTRG